MPTSNRIFTALVLVLASAPAACSSFGSDPSPTPAAEGVPEAERPDAGDAGLPKAPEVTGTPDPSELNESFGVFVTPGGQAAAAGTRKQPLASIQAGIALGRSLGKRVYVCGGTFHESLVIADSISVIGGLDCSREEWRAGTTRTRVEAPASPAAAANGIASATRIENLELIAPDASEPGGSSFGLLAVESPGLSLVGSRVEAGSGSKGADGVEGIQLVPSGTPAGSAVPEFDACFGAACTKSARPKTPGGTRICAGEAGHDGETGGVGGSGGLYEYNASNVWVPYLGQAASSGDSRFGAGPAAVGAPGASATVVGTLSAEGFAPADGARGGDGERGRGGRGGTGFQVYKVNPDLFEGRNPFWHGTSGAGGGAGGCPGLAGSPGKGGGASVAVFVAGAPIKLERSDLIARDGGPGGRGTFGSDPTPGGAPGAQAPNAGFTAGTAGFAGSAAGVSGSGAGGPSYALAYTGDLPSLTQTTTKVGQGGAGVAAETKPGALGVTRTLAASASGDAKEIVKP